MTIGGIVIVGYILIVLVAATLVSYKPRPTKKRRLRQVIAMSGLGILSGWSRKRKRVEYPVNITSGCTVIETDQYEKFLLSGSGLGFLSVSDSDLLLTEKLKKKEKEDLPVKHPILVSKFRHNLVLSNYRVGKFLAYIDFIDLTDERDLYESTGISINFEYFQSLYRFAKEECKWSKNKQYCLMMSCEEEGEAMLFYIEEIKNLHSILRYTAKIK